MKIMEYQLCQKKNHPYRDTKTKEHREDHDASAYQSNSTYATTTATQTNVDASSSVSSLANEIIARSDTVNYGQLISATACSLHGPGREALDLDHSTARLLWNSLRDALHNSRNEDEHAVTDSTVTDPTVTVPVETNFALTSSLGTLSITPDLWVALLDAIVSRIHWRYDAATNQSTSVADPTASVTMAMDYSHDLLAALIDINQDLNADIPTAVSAIEEFYTDNIIATGVDITTVGTNTPTTDLTII